MKRAHLYAGIGGWVAAIALAAAALGMSGGPTEDAGAGAEHAMGDVVVHEVADGRSIAVRVTSATLQLDSRAPTTCLLGACAEDRDAGKYTAVVSAEVTNLSSEQYRDLHGRFELEGGGGERWSASRPIGIGGDIGLAAAELADPGEGWLLDLGGLDKGETAVTRLHYTVDPPVSAYTLVIGADWSDRETAISLDKAEVVPPELCSGAGSACFGGFVESVGADVIEVRDAEGGAVRPVALALVAPPDGGGALRSYLDVLEGFCPPGAYALFDGDGGGTGGEGDPPVGKLYCEGEAVNEQLLGLGLASSGCAGNGYAQGDQAASRGCE